MLRLLVGMDMSAASDRALRRAVLLARQTGAGLQLVRVVAADPENDAQSAAVLAAARASLEELCATLHTVDGVEARAQVVSGEPHLGLLAVADATDADLLVVGAPPRAGRAGLPAGTVERVLRATPRPVLISAGVPTGFYESVVLATDLSSATQAALRAVVRLGLDRIAELAIIHVFDAPLPALRETDRASIRDQAEAWVAAERTRRENELAGYLADSTATVRRRLLEPNTSTRVATLLGLTRDVAGDLIVIGAHERSRLGRHLTGSMLAGLLRAGTVDVLVVPLPASEPA